MFDWYDATGYRIAFFTLALPAIVSVYLYLTMTRPVPPASTDEASQQTVAGPVSGS
jgi:hypothetical protein